MTAIFIPGTLFRELNKIIMVTSPSANPWTCIQTQDLQNDK
jgi:hypothetical protein